MAYDLLAPPFEPGSLDLHAPAFEAWLNDALARRKARIAGRPQILIGASAILAQPFVEAMIGLGQVVALLDNAAAGKSQHGVPVIGDGDLDGVLAATPDAVGVLCCGSENAINHFRRLWGQRPQPLVTYFEVIAEDGGQVAGPHLQFLAGFSDLDGVRAAHAAARRVLHDRESLRTLDAVMLYRLTWDGALLDGVSRREKAIYFEPDVMPLTDDEVFIDGGAFDGDTVHDFVAATGGRYSHIHAFELDPRNADAFQAKTRGVANVTLHSLGLWNGRGEVGLDSQGDNNGSRISEASDLMARVEALDNLDLGQPSLIKLDIEGAEVPALAGMRDTIQRHRPKLAVCAYHKADDLVTIIDAIRAIRDDYSFTLRHYSPIVFDSVIYCT